MQLYKRGKYFWIRFTVNGVQHRVSTKEATKTAAGARAMEIVQDIKEQGVHRVPKAEPVAIPVLREFADGWFSEWIKSSARLSHETRRYYGYGMFLLKLQPIMSMPLDAITEEDADMVQTDHSPSTHNCALRTLSRMLNLAQRRGIIMRVPRVRLLVENKRTRLVEPGIEAKIAAVLANRKKGALNTALYLMLDAGMRPVEIVNMKIEDVNFDRGFVYVPKSKTHAGERYLPLTDRMKSKLFAQIGNRTEGWMFPSPKKVSEGKPITTTSLARAWRRACRVAGVPDDLKLYCARHTFGTDAMDATKNAFLVMKALGHTELSTTLRYQHHDIVGLGEQMNARNQRRSLAMVN